MQDNWKDTGVRLFAALSDSPLTDELRSKAVADAGAPAGWTALAGSLSRDPASADKLYLCADGGPESREHVLLAFHRAADGLVTVEQQPFASTDRAAIRDFAERIDRSFLPRPQGDQPGIATGNRHPEISLPAAFDAFGRILAKKGVNMASTVQLSATREMTLEETIAERTGDDPTAIGHTRISIEHLYHAGLWAAIRSGWRAGYTAEADHFIVTGESDEQVAGSIEMVKESIRRAAGYTKFTTDSSRMFALHADERHPSPWSDAEIESRFEQLMNDEERAWTLKEFSQTFVAGEYRYQFSAAEIRRLAVKFVQSLKLNEELYDFISEVKGGEPFDFEPSIDEAETLTTAKELLFYMHWLAARGRPATLVPPNLGFKKRQAYPDTADALAAYVKGKMWPELAPRVNGEFGGDPLEELGARVRELAAVAKKFDGTLSIHSGSGKQAAALEMIGRATEGRVNYKISGELQLQLLDVLSEQPAGSPWRLLFERMADAAAEFAAKNAFGCESGLSSVYIEKGLRYSIGDAMSGRVDGNLFLVFWIGNLVGTRDYKAPDGDTRFFKEKLDELPPDLLAEVRRRNSDYIVWLADCLLG